MTTNPQPCLRDWLEHLDPRLVRCGYHAAPADHHVEGINRRMEMFDLWHVASGAGTVSVNGRWHDFGADDLIALFPGDLYEAERTIPASPFRLTYAYLHLWPATGDHQLARQLRPHWPVVMSLRRQPAARKWFAQLFEWSVDPRLTRARCAAIKGTCWLILDAIWTELENPQPSLADGMSDRLLQTCAYIDRNLAEPIRLADIAAAAALSVSALESNFRRAYGLPPVAYLLRRRVEKAQLLLAQGMKPKAVCAETGFRSLQYFSRFFRSHVGVSPRAFARANARHPLPAD